MHSWSQPPSGQGFITLSNVELQLLDQDGEFAGPRVPVDPEQPETKIIVEKSVVVSQLAVFSHGSLLYTVGSTKLFGQPFKWLRKGDTVIVHDAHRLNIQGAS